MRISWQTRRQTLYFATFFLFLVIAIGVPTFISIYRAPTCFDEKRNQGEEGIDCNGLCERLCLEKIIPPVVNWARLFHVSGDVYSVTASVENFNADAGSKNLPYTFEIYDDTNRVLSKVSGTTFILPKQAFLLFEGGIVIKGSKPSSVFLRFGNNALWKRTAPDPRVLSMSDTELLNTDTMPRLKAVLENTSVKTLRDIEVVAVVSDTRGNAIASSRTVIEALAPKGTRKIVFTWPLPFSKRLEVCKVPVDAMVLIDTSGSMNDDGGEPPQPITDAKNAAAAFAGRLSEEDRVGVVSFASVGMLEQPLSLRLDLGQAALRELAILPESETGSTNLGDAIRIASEELNSPRHQNKAQKVLVLLTDGKANAPTEPGGEVFAAQEAAAAKTTGITTYAIGLGNKVNRQFLETSIASGKGEYYPAVNRQDLDEIYQKISASLCEHGPAIIDIVPRSPDVLLTR